MLSLSDHQLWKSAKIISTRSKVSLELYNSFVIIYRTQWKLKQYVGFYDDGQILSIDGTSYEGKNKRPYSSIILHFIKIHAVDMHIFELNTLNFMKNYLLTPALFFGGFNTVPKTIKKGGRKAVKLLLHFNFPLTILTVE